ncbi:hypothetical protein BD779DRAFT_732238 [Infundibulicybe gibba]|nr:hypothetical protein BD779DRAFT_732238 [Infundibulicybe gibba]
MTIQDTVADPAFLGGIEGEISFFRSMMRARPVGIHRHFHILAIQNFILKDTGRLVHIDDLWNKLRACYDLDALDAIVSSHSRPEGVITIHLAGKQDLEAEGYESPNSNNSTPISIRSPSPSENLSGHPFFREEFALPFDEFEPLISQRRMRATVSVPSSPAPSPVHVGRARGGRKRGKSKLNLAGLVGGDSDSSALTQESGDEGVSGTPRDSVVTGTDAGTDYDEDGDQRELSAGKLFANTSSCLIAHTFIQHPLHRPNPRAGVLNPVGNPWVVEGGGRRLARHQEEKEMTPIQQLMDVSLYSFAATLHADVKVTAILGSSDSHQLPT